MAKKRVPLWGKPQGFAVVDTDATRGATIGTDVYNADGSLYAPGSTSTTAETADPTRTRTRWELVVGAHAQVMSRLSLRF